MYCSKPSADKGMLRADDVNGTVGRDLLTCLGDALAVDQDLGGEYQPVGSLAAGNQSSIDQEFVQSRGESAHGLPATAH